MDRIEKLVTTSHRRSTYQYQWLWSLHRRSLFSQPVMCYLLRETEVVLIVIWARCVQSKIWWYDTWYTDETVVYSPNASQP